CHVQRLSLAYHDSKGSTDSTYRIQWDAQSIQYIMIDGLVPFITSVCTLALMLYVSVRLDPQLAMVGLAISPVLLVLMRIYRRRLRGQARAVKALDSSAQSVVQEVLAGIRVVKAFGQEIREQERFVSHSRAGMRARLRLAFVENGFGLLVGLTTAGGTAAVVSIGAHHVLSGWRVPRARWRSGTCPSPMTEVRGSCTTCRSTSRPAPAWASSARRVRARPRW